jgi:predicted enzyme related to lactoylglutathione lyase
MEWSSSDLERTKIFLEAMFAWDFKAWGKEYLLFNPPDGPGGGIMKVDKVNPGDSPVIYIEVDEIESYLPRVEDIGGKVKVPKTEIPAVGWHAVITDHDGNSYGLFQERKRE